MVDRLALEALGVSKRYGDRDALCGTDLIARPRRTQRRPEDHADARVARTSATRRRHRAPAWLRSGFAGRPSTRRGRRLRGDAGLLSVPVWTKEPRVARPSRQR